MPPTKTHRVDGRIVVPLAVLAGTVAALGPASPTGARLQDAVVVGASVAFVTWAGATARWWALVALSVGATAIAGSLLLVILGAASVAGAVWIGTRQRDLPTARALVVAVSLNVAIRSHIGGFLGLSAIITIGVSAVVVVSGLRRRRGQVRRGAVIGLAVVGVLAALAIVGSVIAAVGASRDLRDANVLAHDGISMLGDGEYATAADRFDEAAGAFTSSNEQLTGVWSTPSAWLPVIAQQRSAAAGVSSSAAQASNDLAAALRVIDPEQLRLVGGRFDLDAIRLIEQPFVAVQESIADLRGAIDRAASPWLIGRIADSLADLETELADNQSQADNAVTAIRLAPRMLGAEGARRYFIAFTTPAEARGMGGFMGNWAVLTTLDGRLRLSEFGRTRDLNLGGEPPRYVTGPADWLEQWGQYGFTDGPDGSTSSTPWSNVTISPVFPSTAQVVQELLPQSGQRPVDGVFALDPQVLQALLSMTGPISVDGSDVQLGATNVLQFLLVDQYETDDNDARVDLLEEVSRATIDRVLGGALPNPTVVARELGPMVAQGRLVGSASDPDEQALFESVGLADSLPALAGGDGIAAVFNNAGGNKIDVYLERDLSYTAVVDERTGAVAATLELTLTNTADPDVLPDAVVSNYTGDALGTNRTLLSLYSALPLQSVTVDGKRIRMREGEEAGWRVNSAFLGIAAGGSITVTAEYGGILELPAGYTLAVRPQPLVVPERQSIDVTAGDGSTMITRAGIADRPGVLIVGPGSSAD